MTYALLRKCIHLGTRGVLPFVCALLALAAVGGALAAVGGVFQPMRPHTSFTVHYGR